MHDTMKRRTTAKKTPVPLGLASVSVTLLEQLFDQSPDVTFFVKDAEGRYVAVNDSLARRHGFAHKHQVLGKRPSDICPGDLGQIPADQDAAVVRTGQPLLNHLELHWYQPEKAGWCLTTKLPIVDEAGRVTGIIGLSRDVRVPVEPDEIPASFASAVAEFEQNLDQPVSPASLAEAATLSLPRLARLTKRLFGLTPGHFITKTRITGATRLLQETDWSVAQIAAACGFADQSAFTRAFRGVTGVTPSTYRAAVTPLAAE